MAIEYKLYFTDPTGHIHRRVDLECADDREAIEVAARHIDGLDLELWTGSRFVKKFASRDGGGQRQ